MAFNGMKIKTLREERGESLEQIASVLTRRRQAISLWEHGKTAPPMHVLSQLAQHFGVPESFFFD